MEAVGSLLILILIFSKVNPLERLERMNLHIGDFNLDNLSVSSMFSEFPLLEQLQAVRFSFLIGITVPPLTN